MRKNKRSFTLIELLVAMSVIALLIGLSVFGIQQILKGARDTQRRKFLNDMQLAFMNQTLNGGTLPIELTGSLTTVTVGNTVLRLQGALKRSDSDSYSDHHQTTADVTDYCYRNIGPDFVVGAWLENGTYYFVTNTTSVYTEMNQNPTGGPFIAQCNDGIF